MRSFFVILVLLVGFSGCVKKNKVPTAQNVANPAMHEVKVNEVIQTSNYTYLKVSDNGTENWIAVTSQEAAAGEVYYYDQALEMKNFKSKELDRTFETIYFVQGLSKQPIGAADAAGGAMGGAMGGGMAAGHTGKATDAQNADISVAPAEGSVSIAQLFASRNDFGGKKIKMKGQVVKINDEVMGKNWIHIQDGTKDGENFDLTITTLDKVKLDDVVTFEGTISLKKDFGYGYFYELIMEDAKLVK
ncbi:MAG: SH3-like domain-containing protein [Prolixibacteraceae bacterium]|nr:SH3-like domain-containing protein [Prolixibacteraceae bacterium]